MPYIDTIIGCRGCKNDFVFTADEQALRAEQGLSGDPEYCADCQEQARFTRRSGRTRYAARGDRDTGFSERAQHPVVCSICGADTSVPFIPSQDKPVYCASCYQKERATRDLSLR